LDNCGEWMSPKRGFLVPVPSPDKAVVESVEAFMPASVEWLSCPHCGEGRFAVVAAIPSAARSLPLRGRHEAFFPLVSDQSAVGFLRPLGMRSSVLGEWAEVQSTGAFALEGGLGTDRPHSSASPSAFAS
jgi:hypothetical protein